MKILIILVICILLVLFFYCKNYRERYETSSEKKTDFVTLCFENEIEMDLMKLQAMSFSFVPPDLVHEIIVCSLSSFFVSLLCLDPRIAASGR